MICILKFTKGHNSINSVVGATVLVLLHRLIMLNICNKFCQSMSKDFRVTDLNSRVDARVANRNTNGQMDGKQGP